MRNSSKRALAALAALALTAAPLSPAFAGWHDRGGHGYRGHGGGGWWLPGLIVGTAAAIVTAPIVLADALSGPYYAPPPPRYYSPPPPRYYNAPPAGYYQAPPAYGPDPRGYQDPRGQQPYSYAPPQQPYGYAQPAPPDSRYYGYDGR